MASVKLIVKSKKKSQPATVYLRLRQGKKIDITIPTALKLFPEYWNNVSQSFRHRIMYTGSFTEKDKIELENRFIDLKNLILKNINIQGKIISKEWLTKTVFDYFNPDKSYGQMSLNQYIEKFIEQIRSGKRLTEKKERYKPLTVKNYKGFKSQFDSFQIEKAKKLNFEDITIDFYDEFVDFFNRKNYSPNTIGRHIAYS